MTVPMHSAPFSCEATLTLAATTATLEDLELAVHERQAIATSDLSLTLRSLSVGIPRCI